jgi:hypothetical protein
MVTAKAALSEIAQDVDSGSDVQTKPYPMPILPRQLHIRFESLGVYAWCLQLHRLTGYCIQYEENHVEPISKLSKFRRIDFKAPSSFDVFPS